MVVAVAPAGRRRPAVVGGIPETAARLHMDGELARTQACVGEAAVALVVVGRTAVAVERGPGSAN